MNTLDDVLDALAVTYLVAMPPKVQAFLTCVKHLSNGQSHTLETTIKLAHDLTGSGGTYGFPEITERAIEVELLLKGLTRTVTSEKVSMLDQEVTKLSRLVDKLTEERIR